MLMHTIKTVVISRDIFLYMCIVRAVYLIFYEDLNEDNKITIDRLDPEFLPREKLISILNSRRIHFNPDADLKSLIRIAKSKVRVEKSERPKEVTPSSLTNEELKRILDHRGIMYRKNSSKQDLVIAVNISGQVSEEAMHYMNHVNEPEFSNIYELNVDSFNDIIIPSDIYDSLILIHILPLKWENRHLHQSSWKELRRKLSYMDFKFGRIHCYSELHSLCSKKGWTTSNLLWHVPSLQINYFYPIEKQYDMFDIVNSIHRYVAANITYIESWDTFTSWNWTFYRGNNDETKIRVVFVSNMTMPPMFFSALSVKYKKEVSFGVIHVDIKSDLGRTIMKKLRLRNLPSCIVITPQSILNYGALPYEHFIYDAFDKFLAGLVKNFKPQTRWHQGLLQSLTSLLEPGIVCLLILRASAWYLLSKT